MIDNDYSAVIYNIIWYCRENSFKHHSNDFCLPPNPMMTITSIWCPIWPFLFTKFDENISNTILFWSNNISSFFATFDFTRDVSAARVVLVQLRTAARHAFQMLPDVCWAHCASHSLSVVLHPIAPLATMTYGN